MEEKLKPSLYSEFLKPELFLDIKIGLSREDMTVGESCFSWIPLGAKTAKLMFGPVREGVNGKKTFSFGHCPNDGGVYPCPNFLALLLEVHFWSIKRVYFFKNANVLNF